LAVRERGCASLSSNSALNFETKADFNLTTGDQPCCILLLEVQLAHDHPPIIVFHHLPSSGTLQDPRTAETERPSEHDFTMNITSDNDETASQDGTHQQLRQSVDGNQGASIKPAAKEEKWCYRTQDPRCQSIHSLQRLHICVISLSGVVGTGLFVSSAGIISIYQPHQGQTKLVVEGGGKGAWAEHPRPTLLLDMFVSRAWLFFKLLPIVATRLEQGTIFGCLC